MPCRAPLTPLPLFVLLCISVSAIIGAAAASDTSTGAPLPFPSNVSNPADLEQEGPLADVTAVSTSTAEWVSNADARFGTATRCW